MNIKYSKEYLYIRSSMIIFIVGVLFCLISLFLYPQEKTFEENTIKTEALLSNLTIDKNEINAVYSYSIDDVEYETVLHNIYSNQKEGESYTIYVDRSDPNIIVRPKDIKSKGVLGVGVLLIVISVLAAEPALSFKKFKKRALESKNIVKARVSGLSKDWEYLVGEEPSTVLNLIDDQGKEYRSSSFFGEIPENISERIFDIHILDIRYFVNVIGSDLVETQY